MTKRLAFIGLVLSIVLGFTACKSDVAYTGQSVLDPKDEIIVLADTFAFHSGIDSCQAIISQADSFLLGEIETNYGVLRASILTQLACPEGYHYPSGPQIKSLDLDSVCLFMYYSSWVGDEMSPLAIDAYLMDKKTFRYSGTYPTDLDINDYCSHTKSILTNHRIVVASEKLDSVQNSSGTYTPMVRMRVNDEFANYFWSIQNFEDQDSFNDLFKGVLIESSFGSSTMLNISDIALGVYFSFSYEKTQGNDTLVHDMKAFYANSEVRMVNHLAYLDKSDLIESLQNDSDSYNYIIAPAGVYTRLSFPMKEIADSIMMPMKDQTTGDTLKRVYVNKASVRVDVENVFSGSSSDLTREDWLQPAPYMLLIKKQSMERFFKNRELPTDTCALLGTLTQSTDSVGDAVYYYSYDLSEFLTDQLRKNNTDEVLDMLLVPVTIQTSTTSSATVVSSVRQQQTMSATKIRSAKNGMELELVYSGF